MGFKSASSLPPLPEVDTATRTEPFPLSMLGAGGFGTASHDLGWTGEWSEYSSNTPPADENADTPAKGNCCGLSVQHSEPEMVTPMKSCCTGKIAPKADKQTSQPEYFGPTMHSREPGIIGQLNLNFQAPALLDNYAYPQQPLDGMEFTEDQFGCLHEPDHACKCGEGCECLGCSIHPANRATTDYVRYHTELTMREWADPTRFQMPELSSQGQQFDTFATTQPLQGFQNVSVPLLTQHNPYMAQPQYMQPQFLTQWRNLPNQMTTPSLEMSQFSFQQVPPTHIPASEAHQARPRTSPQAGDSHNEASRIHARHISVTGADIYDHDSPSIEDDSSTLSPSAFSVQRYDIPGGCNDMTGNCLCGEGCECEGCLTHNGRHAEHEPLQTELLVPRTTAETNFAHNALEDMLQEATFPLTGLG